MSPRRTRVALIACGMALILIGVPARSEACEALSWIWPWNWCRGAASATTYQPAYVAPSYMPTQTCSYVPQTAYRAVSRVVPTTTCMPVTYCDPCSGCPVTCYRPTTSLVRTTQLIPYTTYRMVWSNPCVSYAGACDTGCGSACGTGMRLRRHATLRWSGHTRALKYYKKIRTDPSICYIHPTFYLLFFCLVFQIHLRHWKLKLSFLHFDILGLSYRLLDRRCA